MSVTDRCNLRCSYCMPEKDYVWLPKRELLDFDELSRLIECFAHAGVDRVRITGGEPLLRRELDGLVARIADTAGVEDIALTTNAVCLRAQAGALAAAGLKRITVSLDTLRRDRFAQITRRDELDTVLDGIEAARETWPRGHLKIDTVVMRGVNDDELVELIQYGERVAAEVRFIEYMDVGGATQWSPDKVVTRGEMLASIERELGPPALMTGRGSAPAERFRLPDGSIFGIIASTTAPFCGACDRSRLTADGAWYHCLYGTRGVDLKGALRGGASNEQLASILSRAWSAREDRGAEQRAAMPHRGSFVPVEALRADPHLEMHTRGG